MRRILERRIERVPDWAHPALYLAAILGRQIDPQLLKVAEPDTNIEDWITVCANAAVFDTQDGRWRFAHDKLRECILDQLMPKTGAALHRRAAEAIEQVYSENLDDYAAALAEHWAAAGDDAKEGYYSQIAGKQLVEASDYHTALRLSKRALELKTYENADNSKQALAQLHHQIGRACYALGEYQQAGEWYQSALGLFQEIGDQYGIALTIGSLSEIDFRQGKYQQAKPLAEQALALSREIGDLRQIGYSLMNLGVIAASDGDLLEAKTLFEECLACMKELGEPISTARALNNLAISYDFLGDISQAKLLHTQALAIRRRINDRHGIAYSLSNLAALAEIEGNYEMARRWSLESLAILRSMGEKMSVATALGQLSQLALKTKDFDTAEQYAQESLALRQELGDLDGTAISLCDLGNVARERGDYDGAWHWYQQSLQQAQHAALQKRAVGTFIQIARLKNETGEQEIALELLLFAQRSNQNFHVPTDQFDPLIAELRAKLPATVVSDIESQSETTTLEMLVEKLLMD
jgi:tetratricopeptide (TPR) repeat protein